MHRKLTLLLSTPFSIIASISTMAMDVETKIVTVVADIETSHESRLINGNILRKSTIAKFYRNGAGRTRVEREGIVNINDPTSGTVLVLDVARKTARRIVLPGSSRGTGRISRLSAPTHNIPRSATDLGAASIEGYEVERKRYTTTIPAGSPLGNSKELTKVTEVWLSTKFDVVFRTQITDPISGLFLTEFKNIKTNIPIDDSLFIVPLDFSIQDAN